VSVFRRSAARTKGRPFAQQCERVCTYSGQVAHLRHADPERGIVCAEMHDWPGEWFPAPKEMPLHSRCRRAAEAEDAAREAAA
jgi:hypothetical protein